MTRTLLLAGLLAVGGVSLSAEQARPDPRTNALLGALRSQRSNEPYRGLFTPQRPLPAPPASSEPIATMGCGATTLEVNPYFDQKKVDSNNATKYRIRAVPTACVVSR